MADAVRRSLLDVATPTGTARLHLSVVPRPRALLVLGHGAGRGVDTDDLLGLAAALPAHGVSVVLVDQPWVVSGRRVAAPPAALDPAWVLAVAAAREAGAAGRRTPVVAGGRSAGARVACRTAEEVGAAALLLLAVPLVPPAARKDAERRATALAARRAELRIPLAAGIPVVAAQGERDAFGSPAQLRSAIGRPRSAVAEVMAIEGADHSLRVARGAADPGPRLLAAALRAVALARGDDAGA